MRVTIHKANGRPNGAPVESLEIVATEPFPELRLDEPLKVNANLHVANARAVVAAMLTHLPGGTVDAILRELLLARASHFIVPFGSSDYRGDALRAERICEEVAEALDLHDCTYVPGALAQGIRDRLGISRK